MEGGDGFLRSTGTALYAALLYAAVGVVGEYPEEDRLQHVHNGVMHYSVRVVGKSENYPLLRFIDSEHGIWGGLECLSKQSLVKLHNVSLAVAVVYPNAISMSFPATGFFVSQPQVFK